MDKVFIYFRLGGCDGGWWKYYKRPLTIEKAKAKLAKLRTTRMNIEFCMAVDGRIVKE